MCACLEIPMEVKPLEACHKTASAQFEAASKEAGANPFGALDDHDYDAESVETMAKEAAAYRSCMSQTLEATTKARASK